jgi:hypothetical protein
MAEARARRLGNLRPPFKKGEVANPTGRNGRDKPNEIAKFLDQPESVESNRTRFEAIVDRLFRLALRGDTLAAKVLVEYKLGKPRTPPNELDLAEHMRKVARDGADLALRVLGSRIHSMPPKELAEFFRSCAGDTEAFFEAAEGWLCAGRPHDPQIARALTNTRAALARFVAHGGEVPEWIPPSLVALIQAEPTPNGLVRTGL